MGAIINVDVGVGVGFGVGVGVGRAGDRRFPTSKTMIHFHSRRIQDRKKSSNASNFFFDGLKIFLHQFLQHFSKNA